MRLSKHLAKLTKWWGSLKSTVLSQDFQHPALALLLFSYRNLGRSLNHSRLQWFLVAYYGGGLQLSFCSKIRQFSKCWMMATETQRREKTASGIRRNAFPAPLKSGCGSQMNIWAAHASVSPWPSWREASGTGREKLLPGVPAWPPSIMYIPPAGGRLARTSWHLGGQQLGFSTHWSSPLPAGGLTTESWDLAELPFLF